MQEACEGGGAVFALVEAVNVACVGKDLEGLEKGGADGDGSGLVRGGGGEGVIDGEWEEGVVEGAVSVI